MKKLIFGAAVLASAFFAASCQQEMLDPQAEGTTVTYTVEVPNAIATKATGDGFTLHYEVYRQDDLSNLDAVPFYEGKKAFENGSADVQLEFVKDQEFTVLFWAQQTETDAFKVQAYDITDLREVSLKTLVANDVTAEVFAGNDHVSDCKSDKNGNVVLVRPVAQLNIATTAESFTLGTTGSNTATVTPTTSEVVVNGLYETYNVATGTAETKASRTYTEADVPGSDFKNTYKLMATNYLGFIPQAGDNVEVKFTIYTEEDGNIEHTVSNVPVKANYQTNILGNLISATADYQVTLEDWADAGKDMEVLADGIVKFNDSGVYQISNANGLAYASKNLFANGGSYILTADIDMSEYTALETKAGGKVWEPVEISHKTFVFDGKGHTISNLPGMFVRYTIWGDLTIKNLTLNNPKIAYDIEDKSDKGVGAFFGFCDAFNQILLENCHVKGGEIVGGHWTGGLIGFAAGHNAAGVLTINNCSVKETTVTGKGSCGGIIGHANGGNGLVEMNTISVFSNTIKSTGTDTNKAGSVMGTVGSATVKVTNCSVIDNEVTSNGVSNTKLWGRQGSSTGVLYVDGVQVEDFGTFTPSTTVTVTNDEELAKAIEVKDVTTIKLATGTYSDNIVLTVAAEGNFQRDLKFEAVEGASPVIAGTVTLGYRNQGVAAAMWDGNVTFEGITFDHAEAAKHSISVGDVKSLTLKNCTIIGDGEYGIDSARGNATGTSKIEGCTFVNAAMQLLGNLATGLVIDGCIFNESRINVQAGNGVTVQNCTFNSTLKSVHVGDSFYCVRSNSTPITVTNCEINIDSELTEVAASQAKWYLLANRGTTNWTVENVAVTLSDAALMQTELDITACTSTGVINTTNLTVNGKVYASTAAQLTAAVNNGATDIVLAGEFEMPGNGTTNAITFSSLNGTAVIDNTKGSYWENATLTFNNISFKTGTGMVNGNGADYAALYSKNVTYNSCTFTGPMRLGRDGAKFNACTFNGLGNDYVWTYGNSASFEGCTFNTEGKAILIYSDGPTVGTGAAPAVSVTNCTFNATQGAKAGAIANQNCAAVEIHNYGNGVTLTTSGNTVDEDFSGVWRIKTYENRFPDSKIFVNGTEYTTIALDGKTMTIDANRNVTVL